MQNPYRTDYPGSGLFYGRGEELHLLRDAIQSGRRSIAAVMGGRGMGKTSFALRLRALLGEGGITATYLIRKPEAEAHRFLAQLGHYLQCSLDPALAMDSLIEAIDTMEASRVVLLIDEIEGLIGTAQGRILLDNLRIAWEALAGKLGIVIFGGSALRALLSSDTSPFLRTAQWLPLRGLSREDTAALLTEPCDLDISEELIEVLWEQTGGHPLLLQAIMERAMEMGPPVIDHVPGALSLVAREQLESTIFPVWWENLQERGQAVYRALLAHGRPVLHHQRIRVLGNAPHPWIEILETTGIARGEKDEILPRGELFRIWMQRNHPSGDPETGSPTPAAIRTVLAKAASHPLEEEAVTATARWSRGVVEYPGFALKSVHASGNSRLLPEQNFQLGLLLALQQRDLLVEAEALSSARGRSDLKIRWPQAPDRRSCIEIKIWGRNDYADIVTQLLEYALPDDDFGCVVMIDRQSRPLRHAYWETVLQSGALGTVHWPAVDTNDASLTYPAFLTEHPRASGLPLRIYHFLVQLAPDQRRSSPPDEITNV